MKIEHIAFWVEDLEVSKRFYEQYFLAKAGKQYHNPKKNFTSYFLSFKNGSRLEIMHKPEIKRKVRPSELEYIGISHIAFSTGSEERVNNLTEALRADGFSIIGEPRRTGDGYYESVILDPDGIRIEITE